ncbi:hypothetical protein QE152_g29110 [Popillia japonica]|uniref:Uncharacterized protein n=1 Tax=Popillia japonica TaxID=7064 RepID=A0AAW1JIR6_POPJA
MTGYLQPEVQDKDNILLNSIVVSAEPGSHKANENPEINHDFEQLYPNCSLKLINEWDSFFSELYSSTAPKTDVVERLYSTLLEATTDDSRIVLQLFILNHLIPTKGRKRSSSGHWKFFIQESSDSMIEHATTVSDIKFKLEDIKEKAASRGVKIQPYLLIEGPQLLNINNVYLHSYR